jgi:hypothetical protein
MKKIYIFTIIALLVVIIILGSAVFFVKTGYFFNQGTAVPQNNVKEKVVLIIDDGEGNPKSFNADFFDGMTAFDLLKNKTDEAKIALKTKNYDIGVLVQAIGDKENGAGGKYWLYYVNGEMPNVGAEKKQINPGDKVEFKFEKSPF